ncbi:uncharacterized protein LOC119483887 [Sebastes umbrosus]|uniref:uncharacterized protein LOC119483887 n=1 Tax=Sebastes umbrosus TaxID=72105 RepID=UPI00189FAF51|nr:uncharacterized protein LOC119483887 [Sebastes umbrosus]
MVSSRTSQPEAIMPEFNVRRAVSKLLNSFFKGMTADQWGFLKSGSPDDSTMTMMGELLLDITAALTKAFLKSLGSRTLASEDDVQINLGDTISQGFAEALGVDVSVQCPSSKSLTTLISEEVSESVRSALSSPEGIVQRLTPPGKLNSMILHACKMCQAFIGRMKAVFSPRRHKQRTISEESDVEPEPSDAKDCHAATFLSDAVISMKDNMYVTIIIKKQLNDITEPLLVDVPDSEYTLLQSQNAREIADVAEDIARSIAEDAVRQTPSEQKSKRSKKNIGSKLKKLLAKCFAKTCIHRIVAQMTKRFHRGSKVHSRESAKSFTKKINDLMKKPDNRDLLGLGTPLLTIPPGRVLEFTKVLSDLLYTHILHGPEIIPEPVIRANMRADLQRKVLGFLSLARWWQIFQSENLVDNMRHAILGTKPRAKKPLAIAAPSAPVSVTKSCDDFARRARNIQNKNCIEALMERLVTRIFKKAKVTWTVSNVQDIIQRLFEQTWAEVEGLDFDSSQETLENLEKAICRDLIKTWGNAMWLLVSLKGGELAVVDHIAFAVKGHLMVPRRQRSCMCSFFSSMLTAMTRW